MPKKTLAVESGNEARITLPVNVGSSIGHIAGSLFPCSKLNSEWNCDAIITFSRLLVFFASTIKVKVHVDVLGMPENEARVTIPYGVQFGGVELGSMKASQVNCI